MKLKRGKREDILPKTYFRCTMVRSLATKNSNVLSFSSKKSSLQHLFFNHLLKWFKDFTNSMAEDPLIVTLNP